MTERNRIPSTGEDPKTILDAMQSFRKDDADWKKGRIWSMVYYAGEDHLELLKKAHNAFFSENGLNPMAFRSLKRMELDVVDMTASMLHAPDSACGTMTSGGTESLLLAVKTYRDFAKKERPWIRRPEVIAPETIHVAVDKAAHYFGVKLVHAKIGADYRVDIDDVRRKINRNTVAIMGSAPQYPQGVIDPIVELGALALERRLPLHVDACIGGFMLPWIERAGYPMPLWDFRVPGVTSISADVHKYGYAAKGASVIVYRDMKYLRHQFFIATEWSGGVYISPSIPGTRSGGAVAAAWAAMRHMGESGYTDHLDRAMKAALKLREGVNGVAGLTVLGEPHGTLVAYGSNDPEVDLFAVADQMEDRGWSMDRQQKPASVHCTVTSNHLPIIESYVDDLRESVAYVRAHPEVRSRGNAAMYGMIAKVPFRAMIKKTMLQVMEGMYGPPSKRRDPDKPGSSDDDGVVMKFVNRYGGKVLGLLDVIDDWRTKRGRK